MTGLLELLGIFVAISSPVWITMYIKHRTKLAELKASGELAASARETAELKHKLTQLTERVAVLESIVTDSAYELQEKFKRL